MNNLEHFNLSGRQARSLMQRVAVLENALEVLLRDGLRAAQKVYMGTVPYVDKGAQGTPPEASRQEKLAVGVDDG